MQETIEKAKDVLTQLLECPGDAVEAILTPGGWEEIRGGGFSAPSDLDVVEYVRADGAICRLRRDAILGLRRPSTGSYEAGDIFN